MLTIRSPSLQVPSLWMRCKRGTSWARPALISDDAVQIFCSFGVDVLEALSATCTAVAAGDPHRSASLLAVAFAHHSPAPLGSHVDTLMVMRAVCIGPDMRSDQLKTPRHR